MKKETKQKIKDVAKVTAVAVLVTAEFFKAMSRLPWGK